jgi:hypothetical protein
MKAFKSLGDVDRARLPPNVAACVRNTVKTLTRNLTMPGHQYIPDEDGYAVLIEGVGDLQERPGTFGGPLEKVGWEGVFFDHGCFVGILLCNNEFGLNVVVPADAPWLAPAARQHLIDNMSDEDVRAMRAAVRGSQNSRSPARRR